MKNRRSFYAHIYDFNRQQFCFYSKSRLFTLRKESIQVLFQPLSSFGTIITQTPNILNVPI